MDGTDYPTPMSATSKNREQRKPSLLDNAVTEPQPPPSFCVNCRHYLPGPDGNDGSDKTKEPPTCGATKFIDLVSGKEFKAYCRDYRHPQAPCGQDARFFEPKVVAVDDSAVN